jgi:hypothetical protein
MKRKPLAGPSKATPEAGLTAALHSLLLICFRLMARQSEVALHKAAP